LYQIISALRQSDIVEVLLNQIFKSRKIKRSQELTSVSEEDKKLLLNRLANYRVDPESATNWINLKQDIYDRYSEQS